MLERPRADQYAQRTGAIVVRVWMDGDNPAALRARVTESGDVTTVYGADSAAATVDEVCAAVRAWLEAFVSA